MNPAPDAAAAPPFSVRIDPHELRHAMRIRGLTGAEVARRSREIAVHEGGVSVSQATMSHALNGRRIHPATLRAINDVLRSVPPLEDVEALVVRDNGVVVGDDVHWQPTVSP